MPRMAQGQAWGWRQKKWGGAALTPGAATPPADGLGCFLRELSTHNRPPPPAPCLGGPDDCPTSQIRKLRHREKSC